MVWSCAARRPGATISQQSGRCLRAPLSWRRAQLPTKPFWLRTCLLECRALVPCAGSTACFWTCNGRSAEAVPLLPGKALRQSTGFACKMQQARAWSVLALPCLLFSIPDDGHSTEGTRHFQVRPGQLLQQLLPEEGCGGARRKRRVHALAESGCLVRSHNCLTYVAACMAYVSR